MKHLLLSLLFSAVLVSCDNNDTSIYSDLKGQWDWKSTCGGVVGCVYSSQTNRQIMTITASEVKKIINGKVESNKHYTIAGISIGNNSKVYHLQYTDGTESYFNVHENTLSFGDSFTGTAYVRSSIFN